MSNSVRKAYSYIRFSTPNQLKGDSLRRQLEASRRYAEEKGLVLDSTLNLKDLGVSAFSGANRLQGALKKFLELIDNEAIPKGSYLLVESLDRVSREAAFDAFGVFSSIIKAGVTIVTLSDGLEYSSDSISENPMQLMFSIMIMSRAHEESAIKSRRIRAAWGNKRDNLQSGKKLTARCPEWLQLSEDKRSFSVLPDRAEIIRRIYEFKLSGFGVLKIEGILNRECKESWMPKNGWRRSYLQKILRNPAVIGEFQPHQMVEGKRTPVGDVIPDYYPPVIEPGTFYAVQKLFRDNRGKGGRVDKARNLFSHIARCGFCGAPMRFVDKGSGCQYFVCDHAKRGVGCEFHSVHYKEVQSLILEYCRQLRVDDLLEENDGSKKALDSLRRELASAEKAIQDCVEKSDNLLGQLEGTSPKLAEAIKQRAQGIIDQQEEYILQEKKLKQKISELSYVKKTAKQHVESFKKLIAGIETDEDCGIDLRLRIREELRRIIKRIDVCPVGYRNMDSLPKSYQRLVDKGHADLDTVMEMFDEQRGNKEFRRYRVRFVNGSYQQLAPARPNKLAVDFQKPEKKLHLNNQLWISCAKPKKV